MTRGNGIYGLSKNPLARRLYAVLRKMPIVGPSVHWVTKKFLPSDTLLWLQISGGLGTGLWVRLDPRFEMIYARGDYESPLQRELSRYLRAGDIFYDVGAHVGIVSMFAGQIVGPTGKVFAFEADPQNVQRIEEHVKRNALNPISVEACAVSSSSGRLRFERASEKSSRNQGALASDSMPITTNTIEVDAVTLDQFMSEHPAPDVIKVDVEGSEAAVLEGSERIFASRSPVLICEIHNEKARRSVTEWLAARNYAVEWLQNSGGFPRHLVATRQPEVAEAP